ncbi:MAG TPA: restriction endonuclease subunit S [Desulfuromonadales bacterium]|nr:restriction endonuclease subunit S [Desulfuromonadales bacterium]
MKAGWERISLGDVCEFDKRQGLHKNLLYVGLEHIESHTGKFIGSTDPIEVKSSTFKFTTEHVLYGRLRPYLNKVLAPDFTGHCSTEIFPLKPCTNLSREFLQYWLLSNAVVEKIDATCTGARMPRANMNDVLNFEFLLPPLPEQQRIVGILDEAFEGIATAKANAEKNLQNARALFESHLQAVFSERGEGWGERHLGDNTLLEIVDGDRGVNYPKADDFLEEGHCLFMNTKNVRPDGFDFESTMFITEEKDNLLRKGKLKRDDVVMTTRGTIGNIGHYSEDVPFQNIRINSGMLIFRPNKSSLLPSFLFEMLRSEIVKDQIRNQTTGAAQPQLPIKTLVNFKIPVPKKLEDQHAIVKKLRAFEPETQRLESIYQQKITALDALKKSLLDQAFRGEL